MDEEQAVAVRELDPTANPALQHNQLLPQRGILCFKSALGLGERGRGATRPVRNIDRSLAVGALGREV
jgi:hypothetical protein